MKCGWWFLLLVAASADAAEINATLDREEVAQDESVTLKIVVEAEGSVPMEEPAYHAPDFETIHQYQGQFITSSWTNGKSVTQFQRTFSYVLRPNTTGKKSISAISVNVDGQTLKAPDLAVTVVGGGLATNPPKNYGSGGNGLRGSAKTARGEEVQLRAEVDKRQVAKGEQIVVSYYMLTRAQSYNAQAEKFPSLGGFLKEEIEVPLIRGQMKEEVVTLDGTVFKKILIARYAAYPLKPGKLVIDPMVLRVNYYSQRGGGQPSDGDDEDDLFGQFFRQMTPRSALIKSEPVTIEVADLPGEGRPKDFNGAVGEFSVLSAVNRYDLRANETVSLTLKIEGRGNLSIVEAPKLNLPEGVQLYESRSQSKEGRGGVGERIFEYLLIPRRAGDFQIPAIPFTFFDPQTKTYVTKSTEPITLRVSPADPSLAPADAPPPVAQTQGAVGEVGRNLPSPSKALPQTLALNLERWGSEDTTWTQILSKLLLGILALAAIFVAGMLVLPQLRQRWLVWKNQTTVKNLSTREWKKLREKAQNALQRPFSEIVQIYENLEDRILRAVEKSYGVPVRALSRDEMQMQLVREHGMSEDHWREMRELLELVETIRFAHRAGAVSEDRIRGDLPGWIEKTEKLEHALIA